MHGSLTDTQGPCLGTVAYLVSSMPGITISFDQIANNLSSPYCLSFIAQTNFGNTQPLLRYYNKQGTEIGSLSLVSKTLTYTIRGESVSFTVATADYHHYQLCTNGSVITLYDDCVARATAEFSHEGFTKTDYITIYTDNAGKEEYSVKPP